MCRQRQHKIFSGAYYFSSSGISLFRWPCLRSTQSLILNIIMSKIFFTLLVFLLLLEKIESDPLVHRSCRWISSLPSSPHSSLLNLFYTENKGDCIYSIVRKKTSLIFRLELQGDQQERKLVFNMNLQKKIGRQKLTNGLDFNVTFIDPTSIHLFKHFKKFSQEIKGKQAEIITNKGPSWIKIKLRGISFEIELQSQGSRYIEQLLVFWLVFSFINYQWFYFSKSQGALLRQFKSLKKGWCFKVLAVFWIKHTSFPLHFDRQILKLSKYFHQQKIALQGCSLLCIMTLIVALVAAEMGKLMRKASFFSKQQLHLREVVDYLLIFVVLAIPLQFALVLGPIAKLCQIWFLLVQGRTTYISYYEQFGKVSLDWIEGFYFCLRKGNFGCGEINSATCIFILSVAGVELLIFLMEIFSTNEFQELCIEAASFYSKPASLFVSAKSRRAEIDICSICLQSFSSSETLQILDDGEEVREVAIIAVTRCGHRFHAHCLQKWLSDGNHNCPLDRRSLKVRHKLISVN